MTAPDFAMVTEAQFRRLSAAAQGKIFKEAFGSMPDMRATNRNADTRWRCVEAASEVYWDARAAAAVAARAKPTGAGLGEKPTTQHPVLAAISAAECNSWLRSLPRLEPGDPP